jgi:sugar-phosphatase
MPKRLQAMISTLGNKKRETKDAMMKAAIFDMDGLLIDSEPLWRQAEKSTFQQIGIELTDQMCHETLGLRPDEAVSHWYGKFPWTGPGREEIERQLLATVRELVIARGRPLDGVLATLSMLGDAGLKLGLASSSPPTLIETVIDKLGIRDYFSVMRSAVDEVRGKPDPAVYLSAAKMLGVDSANCLAFEDSLRGVRSAKSAGMSVIAVPSEQQFYQAEFELADMTLRSLTDFSLDMVIQLSEPEGA